MKDSPPERSRRPADTLPSPEPQAKTHTLARAVAFLAVFATLQGLYALAKGSWIERLVIDQATVRTAAWLIDTFHPGASVEAVGSRLRAPGGGINVLNGCEGVEVVFLLAAAMVVAPLAWRSRISGLLIGTAAIFVLNQARVVSLFFAFRNDKAWFDMLHGVLAPLILICAAGGFFAFWLSRHAQMSVGSATRAA